MRGTGRLGNVEHVGAGRKPPGAERCEHGLEIRVARELCVECFESLRGLEELRRSLVATSQLECNLCAQALHLCSSELVERAYVRNRQ